MGRGKAPKILVDMRHVWNKKAPKEGAAPETQARQHLRELLKENKQQFMNQMAALEKSFAESNAKRYAAAREATMKERLADRQEEKDQVLADKGTEKILDLVDGVLAEFAESET